jgi:hypothetical protein
MSLATTAVSAESFTYRTYAVELKNQYSKYLTVKITVLLMRLHELDFIYQPRKS